MSMSSVMPRLSVMSFHFMRPAIFFMTGSPLGPLAFSSTTSCSLPMPEHSRNAPAIWPWNSMPNHVETAGSLVAIASSSVVVSGRSGAVVGVLAEAEDDELGGLHRREADVDDELPAV